MAHGLQVYSSVLLVSLKKAIAGDTHLGGEDIHRKLVNFRVQEFQEEA